MSNAIDTVPAEIDAETLKSWTANHDDLVVIDVRGAGEFETQHIRGAYNVPLSLLSEHASEFADRAGTRVVLVCQSGVRAEQARQRLGAAGLERAAVLTGGVPAYAAAGGDVVRGKGTWDLERQVRFTAGSLMLIGILGGRFLSPRFRWLSGGIGAGLTVSAATNSCTMGLVLSRMPWNRSASEPTVREALEQFSARP